MYVYIDAPIDVDGGSVCSLCFSFSKRSLLSVSFSFSLKVAPQPSSASSFFFCLVCLPSSSSLERRFSK